MFWDPIQRRSETCAQQERLREMFTTTIDSVVFFLLECVVFGRVVGVACAKNMLGGKVKPTQLAELSDGRLPEKVEV